MASISSIISFVVIFLAAYSYSAPIVSDLQNATTVMRAENATVDFRLENDLILVRRDAEEPTPEKRGNETIGLSSSSSEDETTDKPSLRESNDPSLSSDNQGDAKREVDAEVNESAAESNEERGITDDTLSTEVNSKREADNEERSVTMENTKRGIEVESFQSSTVDDETSTVDVTSSRVKNIKRSLDDGPWLAGPTKDDGIKKRSVDPASKRDEEQSPSLSDQSSESKETRAVEDSSVPSTREVTNSKRGEEQSPSLADESSEAFNQRAVGSIDSTSEMTNSKRDAEQSPSLSDEASETFNRRAIGSVGVESTTDEQLSSSTEIVRDELSSTMDYETTVAPLEDVTRVSSVPTETTSKILAIIPGRISKSHLVVDPATGTAAGFRPIKPVRLSQGQNQTVVKETKPYN